jgi:hypothetical protein
LGANSTLMTLDFRYNALTSIDLSKCTGLQYLRCIDNSLTSLDLSANDSLVYVKCDSNFLTIASLPLKANTWTTYRYHPQKHIVLPKRLYDTYEAIDLKNQVARAGKSSTFTWKTTSGNTLVEGIDYAENSGVFAFLNDQTDSIYCEITNETFPNLVLETSRFTVLTATSIKESAVKTSVFPNPFTDILRIESVEPIKQIEVFSASGVKLFESNVSGLRSVSIPANSLPKGILVINIKGVGYSYKKKLIKK